MDYKSTNQTKKIAFVTLDLHSGGSQRAASELTHFFSEHYQVYYIVFDGSDISYDISAELINLNYPPSNSKIKKIINTFRRAKGIRKAVKQNKIDVVFSFTSIANRALRFSRAKCRKIGGCRGFEDLQNNTGSYHRVIRSGCEMLFNSREMEEFYINRYPRDKSKCITIENLIHFDTIEQKSKDELEDKYRDFFDTHKVVTTVGILSRHKGHWDLLKSFELLREKIPDAGLCIIGHDGTYEKELIDMAKRNKYADDIILCGYQQNPFKFIAKSSVYALSSISEGLPNALLEAMVCHTPAVATSCATGPCEIMFDDYKRPYPTDEYIVADNGILTPPFDGIIDFDYSNKSKSHQIYADALFRAITDRELVDKIVENGYNRAKKNDQSAIENNYIGLIVGKN